MTANPFDKYLTKEDHLQIQVLTFLKMQYPRVLWLHVPNEGKRSPFQIYKAKKMGLRSGWPDLMIYHRRWTDCPGLAIELKIKPNKITANQRECLIELKNAGWRTRICYDFDSTVDAINEYMK